MNFEQDGTEAAALVGVAVANSLPVVEHSGMMSIKHLGTSYRDMVGLRASALCV